ncbi:MAG: hypothetical protein DRQ62_15945 [Gammaproteobacteria bacterium]|nr:MAG: hypothetical protein DRQ62_15945 [Gammaproteobacteria bacterium]
MRNCKQIIELSSQAMETRLPLLTCLEMKFHLLTCKTCCRYASQLSIMQKTLTAMDTNDTGVHLSAEAKQRIAKKLSSCWPKTD